MAIYNTPSPQRQSGNWIQATSKNPCPICHRNHWCSYSIDGAVAICMKVSDGAYCTTQNGGYLHKLRDDRQPISFHPQKTKIQYQQSSIAPVSDRHEVYSAFLENLQLSGAHSDNLIYRGLSDTEICRNRYASVPEKTSTAAICVELSEKFDLTGIPGFYRESNRWRLNVSDWHQGFFIPVRDVRGHIQGLQIRRDRNENPRYVWLSSKDKPLGVSSGSPVHIARAWRAVSTQEAIITEGALKGDIIAEQLDCCVVAVAGVSHFSDDFGQWLQKEMPELQTVFVAVDSDWRLKPEVEIPILRLLKSLKAIGLNGGLFNWNGSKGLDDFLTQGRQA